MVGKGEIAGYEQFLLFLQCFQKLPIVDVSNSVSMEQRVKGMFLKAFVSWMTEVIVW